MEISRGERIKQIRGMLGRTQQELASALGMSTKAVQSYEQGWRDAPVRVMIQLLVLLTLYRRQTLDDVPCWEIRKCSAGDRESCPAFTIGQGQFCYMIGADKCRIKAESDKEHLLPCMECPVVQRLLKMPEETDAADGQN
jgi:DNA-binding XRE family transcriptional regulator